MKLNKNSGLMKFDSQLPVYNWLYPLKGQETDTLTLRESYEKLETGPIRSRALYFHIPFCETICTFCMLNRGIGVEGSDAIEKYVQALIKEVRLKASWPSVTSVPPRVIWFGGGTPTMLTADQIRRIGAVIHECFDLSRLEEFTIEMEVKSVTREKCEAFRDIGVNKARLGLQTFDPRYRELFNITATLEDTYRVVDLLGEYFECRSFDILYGMHGQTTADFAADIQKAIDLGTESCEFYPINHLVTQNALHTGYAQQKLKPMSYLDKMGLTVFANHYLRNSGFRLYNGHGYARLETPEQESDFITRRYSNKYHEYCWAHWDDDLIGFGSSATTQSLDWTIMNDESRTGYIKRLLDHDDLKVKATQASHIPYERGLVLRLPYHGHIEKDRIDWERVPGEVQARFGELLDAGMFEERPGSYAITETGWTWYVNMMYYMSPEADRKILDEFIEARSKNGGITDGDRRMTPVDTNLLGATPRKPLPLAVAG
ncbi:radical SAM protein [Streptomyces sp. WMMB 322]|uniref:radical SAM protein n=1 Tax=Streptomyces sp. WMMB 322 TaxID=1286821 RepID=UPI0006E3C525|nr:radical SAM protein [Streptomyces sp. WMMB 322]SCK10825.1 oxygen-independent coproporphyrinogen-3 oxidase [Streptomyces sp. WMMB 322]